MVLPPSVNVGFQLISLPLFGDDLQLLIILPWATVSSDQTSGELSARARWCRSKLPSILAGSS